MKLQFDYHLPKENLTGAMSSAYGGSTSYARLEGSRCLEVLSEFCVNRRIHASPRSFLLGTTCGSFFCWTLDPLDAELARPRLEGYICALARNVCPSLYTNKQANATTRPRRFRLNQFQFKRLRTQWVAVAIRAALAPTAVVLLAVALAA